MKLYSRPAEFQISLESEGRSSEQPRSLLKREIWGLSELELRFRDID